MSTKKIEHQVRHIHALQLPINGFVVVGSGALAASGIRDAQDIDLIVTEDLWKELSKRYQVERNEWGIERLQMPNDIEILNPRQSIFGNSKIIPFSEIVREAEIFRGIWFMNLRHLKKIKLHLGRPIDLADVELIDEFLSCD